MSSTSSKPFPEPKLPESMANLKSEPKLHLYTVGTPNGHKVSILLEELVRAYPDLAGGKLAYDVYPISFENKDQKSERFLKINPNGRIPALLDDNVGVEGGHNVFETISIMIWLVENYDKDAKFWYTDPILRSQAFSWLAFGQGGVGPMQGQANHFFRYAPEKIPYGIKRYQDETKRLYSVLEDGLKLGKGEWLVGDKYSIADISIYGWVRAHAWAGIEDMSPYPLLNAWKERITARPGAEAGLAIPNKPAVHKNKEEEDEAAKKASKWVMDSQNK